MLLDGDGISHLVRHMTLPCVLLISLCSLNGCSLKTEDNLKAAKVVRLDRLLLETGEDICASCVLYVRLIDLEDAPWCSLTSTHASKQHLSSLPQSLSSLFSPPAKRPEQFLMGHPVKGRNEPSAIGNVAWVVHKLYGIPFEEVVENAWKNTVQLFDLQNVAE